MDPLEGRASPALLGPRGRSHVRPTTSAAPLAIDRHEDVLTLMPRGRLDRTAAVQVRRALLVATAPAVVGLDECMVVDPGALGVLDPGPSWAAADLCFVSGRLTCRLLLARAGLTDRFAVFQQLDEALLARQRGTAFGSGWLPTAAGRGAAAVRRSV